MITINIGIAQKKVSDFNTITAHNESYKLIIDELIFRKRDININKKFNKCINAVPFFTHFLMVEIKNRNLI